MYIYPDLTESFQTLWRSGLVISPWLEGVGVERFELDIHELLGERSRECALIHWTEVERGRVLGDLPAPERMAQIAVYETAASTAVYLAHQQTGELDVTESIAHEAMRRVEQFVDDHGFATLMQLYMLETCWENLNALRHFGEIPERDYVLGLWHRPWVAYSLGEEVLFASVLGNIELQKRGEHRFVRLTDEGCRVLRAATDALQRAGYFRHRLETLRVSQFSQFHNYDQMDQEIWPYAMEQRQTFLTWAAVQPGQRVLELGCADGVVTFAAGLAERVGPTGFVVAVDPSTGMLARARRKQYQAHVSWVEFRRGKAEQLPVQEERFDMALGVGYFHLTDRPQALREMKRVVRPGGVIASWHPLKMTFTAPFFREWFEPIFTLAAMREEQPKDYLLHPDDAPKDFENAGLEHVETFVSSSVLAFQHAEHVVQHFIRGVGWFGEELAPLPWKAREALIEELMERGRFVCQRYSAQERRIEWPSQAIRARVPKNG
ncbi:methyltransferase domain-containing protein [Alicyclobacillus fodiniaquatilis]|uniref:Methyltransferase domain-containing protein n=1 Tax=Alicyclobacillus fodiniaquatilis TaxID=1661150 RepID=A0ABW4JFN6_9BACL